MTSPASYSLPNGIVGLKGPAERPAPGTLPLRGDLAHIALAERYLAAHYVIPMVRQIGASGVSVHLQPRDDSEQGASFAAGETVELLDEAGDWVWITRGPEGPSGYVRKGALAPAA